jgi:hypothetical protein
MCNARSRSTRSLCDRLESFAAAAFKSFSEKPRVIPAAELPEWWKVDPSNRWGGRDISWTPSACRSPRGFRQSKTAPGTVTGVGAVLEARGRHGPRLFPEAPPACRDRRPCRAHGLQPWRASHRGGTFRGLAPSRVLRSPAAWLTLSILIGLRIAADWPPLADITSTCSLLVSRRRSRAPRAALRRNARAFQPVAPWRRVRVRGGVEGDRVGGLP